MIQAIGNFAKNKQTQQNKNKMKKKVGALISGNGIASLDTKGI